MTGLDRLAAAGRLDASGEHAALRADSSMTFRSSSSTNVWDDIGTARLHETSSTSFRRSTKVVQRCLLMTTDPGDLVLDPTCGSGTTAYVAEQWGRRWITIDTSRVPLALARQRLLTATFPYYELKEPARGPAGGFVYKRKQNKKGEEVGGIVPHVTLKSIANNEPPDEEVLVDRPEADNKIVRVTGPFVVEATIPTPVDWEGDGVEDSGARVGAVVRLVRRADDRSAAALARAARRRRQDGRSSATSGRRRSRCRSRRKASRVNGDGRRPVRLRLRPRERRRQREAGPRGAPGSAAQELHAPLRHRLRHPAERAPARRERGRAWASCRRPTSRRRPT